VVETAMTALETARECCRDMGRFWLEQLTKCTAIMKSAFARLRSVAIPLAYDSRKAGRGLLQILFAATPGHRAVCTRTQPDPKATFLESLGLFTALFLPDSLPTLASRLGHNFVSEPDDHDGAALGEQCRRRSPVRGAH
jgi:hypothetical protein